MRSCSNLGEHLDSASEQGVEIMISAMGYADDTYGLGTSLETLQGPWTRPSSGFGGQVRR